MQASVEHPAGMKSRVHPKYRTRYRVTNWREYERGLVRRGDVTIWLSPDALEAWKAKPSGCLEAQPNFSNLAIETALALRLVFYLSLHLVEGFLRSLFKLTAVDIEAHDHTNLSRRSARLKASVASRTGKDPIDLIIDSSGLQIVGQGERSGEQRKSAGAGGRRSRATTGKGEWRTRSSATGRPSTCAVVGGAGNASDGRV
ncbi:MAG: hypothetical protein ACJAQ3_003542 [Planctomycetota bacterium]